MNTTVDEIMELVYKMYREEGQDVDLPGTIQSAIQAALDAKDVEIAVRDRALIVSTNNANHYWCYACSAKQHGTEECKKTNCKTGLIQFAREELKEKP